jgi:hypothetical protein
LTWPRFLLLVALAGFAIHWWQQRSENRLIQAAADAYGFLQLPMPVNSPPHVVLLFAPLNCPGEAARRADTLAATLTKAGIPNIRTSSYVSAQYTPSEMKSPAFTRLKAVMNGAIPIALINGKGKSNPTVEEIIAEYNFDR